MIQHHRAGAFLAMVPAKVPAKGQVRVLLEFPDS